MSTNPSRICTLKIYIGLTAVALGTPVGGNTQESISFPGRQSNMASNSYWAVSEFGEGCCTLDFNVRRFENGGWRGGTGELDNDDDYTWDMPLYAPANGVVASCWRNFPDNPKLGEKLSLNNIFIGGNHVVILTDGGYTVSLNHLKSGSIPAALCPGNSGSQVYPNTMAQGGDWRVAPYIEPADRPRVTEGDFIGRAGNSGNSGGPHLHMSVKEVTGTDAAGRPTLSSTGIPMRIRHGWGHPYNKTTDQAAHNWYRLRGGEFKGDPDCDEYQADTPSCGFKLVSPSPYLRRGDANGGGVKGGDVIFVTSNRAVTASILTTNHNLKLIAWDFVGVSQINRKGDIEVGQVKDVKLSEPTNGYVLAAVRLMNDNLKIIAFRVGATGNLLRVADMDAGGITDLEMATIGAGDKKAVTAVRLKNGNLKLIVWDVVVANNGAVSVVRLGDDDAGGVTALSVSRARNFNGVFTAVRLNNGNLKIIPFKISTSGQTITRGTSADAGAIETVVAVAPLAEGVAAAMRDANGNLRVITWSANSDGDVGARRETGTAGHISEVSLLTSPHGDSNLTTVVRDNNGNLQLIGWAVLSNGTNLRRLGSSDAGAVSKISADVVSRSYPGLDSRDMILTSMRLSNGNLRLISWDTNLVNP